MKTESISMELERIVEDGNLTEELPRENNSSTRKFQLLKEMNKIAERNI